ncbi:MAG: hypothetical protein HOP31_11625 [Ignavibacteria bacterium]|nr:hypothetical protein [Ignavibacteria bacterium]
MERKEQVDMIIRYLWDIQRRVQLWNFIFGKDSSQAKVDEFTEYFTGWINYDLQQCLETKILVDLRGLFDKSENTVISLYKVYSKEQLKDAIEAYTDISKFTNTSITHKNHKAQYSYTFADINKTINSIQKVINDNETFDTLWEIDYIMGCDLEHLYEKVQRVNRIEKVRKKS